MYDFDSENNRRNTNSTKWDVKENELPMRIADMDFKTSSYVEDALVLRAKEGIFGYSEVQTPYYEIVAGWMKRHHKW